MTEWLTLHQAIELSGYNYDHLRDLIKRKKIKAQKFATVWQVSRKSLLAYVKAAEQKQSSDKRYGSKRT